MLFPLSIRIFAAKCLWLIDDGSRMDRLAMPREIVAAIGFPRWRSGFSTKLLLALRAIVRPPTSDDDFLDRRFAGQAGLAVAAIGAVLNLEESGFAIRVNVIGN